MEVVRNLIVPCRNAIVKLIMFTEWISGASLANGYAHIALWSSFILFKKWLNRYDVCWKQMEFVCARGNHEELEFFLLLFLVLCDSEISWLSIFFSFFLNRKSPELEIVEYFVWDIEINVVVISQYIIISLITSLSLFVEKRRTIIDIN